MDLSSLLALFPGAFMFLLVAAVLVGSIWWSSHQRKVWSTWVYGRGWRFIDKWPEMARSFSGGPFGRGSSRRAAFGFYGVFDGLPASGFRYQYSTGSGKNRTTHHYQVLRVQLPSARLPFLTLGPENWATRTFVSDIEFEDAEFNRRWHVQGASPRFVHDVIHPRCMQFLKELDVGGLENLWFEGDSVLLSLRGSIRPEAVDTHLRLLTRFASQLPPFVLTEVAGCRELPITWNGPGVSREEQALRIERLQGGKRG